MKLECIEAMMMAVGGTVVVMLMIALETVVIAIGFIAKTIGERKEDDKDE